MKPRYYTGVGARVTPLHIQHTMSTMASELAHAGWSLRSGHADGADLAFEQGSKVSSIRNQIFLPWAGFNGADPLNPNYHVMTDDEFDKASEYLLRQLDSDHWHKMKDSHRRLHARNVLQLFGPQPNPYLDKAPISKFVICWTPQAEIVGGTATVIKLANWWNIPVFNLADPNDWAALVKFGKTL